MRVTKKRVIIFCLLMIMGVLSVVRIMYVNAEQQVRQVYTYKTGESTITIRLKGTEDVTIYFRPIDVANNIGEARSITLNFDFPGDDNDNNDDNNNSINENSINNNLVNSSNNLNISSNEIEDGRSDKNLPFVGLRNTVVIFIIILCITTVFLIKRNNDFKDVK